MLERRDFLKGLLLGTGVFFNPQNPSFLNLAVISGPKEERKGLYWADTIFCQSGDSELKALLKKLAHSLDCNVVYGDLLSGPDIIAVPNFVTVVDRNEISGGMWDTFISYRIESKDDTLCVVIDSKTDLPLPEINRMKYINRRDLFALREVEIAVGVAYEARDEKLRRIGENAYAIL